VLIVAQLIWLLLVCTLGGWWLWLAFTQARKIAELELAAGSPLAQAHWEATQRMLLGESITFFVLLLVSTGVLAWLYWRDLIRTRGLQAFFASVTHELKTPLTSIRLQTESLAEGMAGSAPEQALVARLLEDCQRLESQVERTLELARVEGGGPVLLESTEAKPMIERVLRLSREQTPAFARIAVTTEIEDRPILADLTAVQVIIRNLLDNIVRHAGPASTRLRVWSEASGPRRLTVHFEDDGRGYSGKPRRLGELFHRGDRSQGAGVGLYLIKVLMQRMGGSASFAAGQGFRASLVFEVPDER
jgi:signal transduction histidine kinase